MLSTALTTAMTGTITYVAPEKAQAFLVPEVKETLEKKPPMVDEVASNCYLYMKQKFPTLPNTSELKPNTTPRIGVMAIFKSPVYIQHYGKIVGFDAEGFWLEDTNWGGAGYRTHYMKWSNPDIAGFWSP